MWNYDYFGDARTIDTHVKKLRSKLGKNADYIKTIWGMDINLRWMNHEKIAENADRGTFYRPYWICVSGKLVYE